MKAMVLITFKNKTMNNRKILAVGDNLMVVVGEKATEFNPIIMMGTRLYDPKDNFRPVNPRPKQKSLAEVYRDEAERLIEEAHLEFIPYTSGVKEVVKEVEKIVEVEKKPNTPYHILDELITNSVTALVSEKIVENVKPQVEKHIIETFGVLPQVHKIEMPSKTVEMKGAVHNKFDNIMKLVLAGIPVFLTGPAGSGKNVICKQISEALESEFYFSNAVTQEYKLTGFIDGNGNYHETQFYKAFTQGGLFMLDEIDASTPEVLVILNAAIANRYFDFPTGRVEAHENFRLVAAGNTYGTGADMEYTGRYQLDASSLDRFAIIEITYDSGIEEAVAGGNMELVSFIRSFRNTVKEHKIKFAVSYRSIERLRKLQDVFDLKEAIEIALIRGLDREDARIISNNISDDSKYSKALKSLLN